MTPTINTRIADLPTTVAAYTFIDENGEYNIIINARLSDERQHKAYEHELHHIQNDDFEKDDLEKTELEAHELSVPGHHPVQNPRPAWVEKRLKKLRKEREKIRQELADYEAEIEPYRILWNETKMLEHQRLGNE